MEIIYKDVSGKAWKKKIGSESRKTGEKKEDNGTTILVLKMSGENASSKFRRGWWLGEFRDWPSESSEMGAGVVGEAMAGGYCGGGVTVVGREKCSHGCKYGTLLDVKMSDFEGRVEVLQAYRSPRKNQTWVFCAKGETRK